MYVLLVAVMKTISVPLCQHVNEKEKGKRNEGKYVKK